MKNKPAIFITAFLFALSAAGASFGYIENKNRSEVVNPPVKEEKINYEYYLEDVLQESIPNNIITDEEGNQTNQNLYAFSRYQCDNNINGNFDEENWQFIPNEVKNGTCKIYFVKTSYQVTITATNGIVEGDNPAVVARESDGNFTVKPNEGYEYKEVICANGKMANYDLSSNTLSVNAIMEDIACKIDFEIKNLKMDLTVKNGKGNTTENANYGESVSAVVQAENGYESPTIKCTNNQTATFSDNKISIAKLTDNTSCTVTFNKVAPTLYKLVINLPESVDITAGSKEQNIESGKDGKFSLVPHDGYSMDVKCDVVPSSALKDQDGKTMNYTFIGVNKNITCNVTATQTAASTEAQSSTNE